MKPKAEQRKGQRLPQSARAIRLWHLPPHVRAEKPTHCGAGREHARQPMAVQRRAGWRGSRRWACATAASSSRLGLPAATWAWSLDRCLLPGSLTIRRLAVRGVRRHRAVQRHQCSAAVAGCARHALRHDAVRDGAKCR